MTHLLRRLATWPVRVYRTTLSRWTPATCRFYPTCSAYCVEAIESRGILRGTVLTVWRILRCHPFARGGYDPLPETGRPATGRQSAREDTPCCPKPTQENPDLEPLDA